MDDVIHGLLCMGYASHAVLCLSKGDSLGCVGYTILALVYAAKIFA